MMRKLAEWESFWDLVSPESGAAAMIEWYGDDAADAAANCAAAALADDRDADYRFWTAVLGRVHGANTGCRESGEQFREPDSPGSEFTV